MAVDFLKVTELLEAEAKRQQWGTHLPMAFEDRPFREAANNSIFVRHSLVFGDGEASCLGGGKYRYPGLQYLAIFFRDGEGNATVRKKASEIVNHYNLKTIDFIVFEVASTVRRPPDRDGWSQLQVVCPFYFDC